MSDAEQGSVDVGSMFQELVSSEVERRMSEESSSREAVRILEVAEKSNSAEEIHNLMARTDDLLVKREILEKALEHKDAVGGDHADFHNLAMEAFRAHTYDLGLEMIECGLRQCKGNPSLVGDKIQALLGVGQIKQGITVALRYWRDSPPELYAADWRPAAFLRRGVQQFDPSFETVFPDDLRSIVSDKLGDDQGSLKWGDVVEKALTSVIEHNPSHIKIWDALSEIQMARGKPQIALNTLRKGLEHNPQSQQLRFTLGQLCLTSRESIGSKESTDLLDEAREHLAAALRADFQEQFQPDMPAGAVMLRLAQAYEASSVGDASKSDPSKSDALKADLHALEKARTIYQQMANDKNVDERYSQFASTRLRCLRVFSEISIDLQVGGTAAEASSADGVAEVVTSEGHQEGEVERTKARDLLHIGWITICGALAAWAWTVVLVAIWLKGNMRGTMEPWMFWSGVVQVVGGPVGFVVGSVLWSKPTTKRCEIVVTCVAVAVLIACGCLLMWLALL